MINLYNFPNEILANIFIILALNDDNEYNLFLKESIIKNTCIKFKEICEDSYNIFIWLSEKYCDKTQNILFLTIRSLNDKTQNKLFDQKIIDMLIKKYPISLNHYFGQKLYQNYAKSHRIKLFNLQFPWSYYLDYEPFLYILKKLYEKYKENYFEDNDFNIISSFINHDSYFDFEYEYEMIRLKNLYLEKYKIIINFIKQYDFVLFPISEDEMGEFNTKFDYSLISRLIIISLEHSFENNNEEYNLVSVWKEIGYKNIIKDLNDYLIENLLKMKFNILEEKNNLTEFLNYIKSNEFDINLNNIFNFILNLNNYEFENQIKYIYTSIFDFFTIYFKMDEFEMYYLIYKLLIEKDENLFLEEYLSNEISNNLFLYEDPHHKFMNIFERKIPNLLNKKVFSYIFKDYFMNDNNFFIIICNLEYLQINKDDISDDSIILSKVVKYLINKYGFDFNYELIEYFLLIPIIDMKKYHIVIFEIYSIIFKKNLKDVYKEFYDYSVNKNLFLIDNDFKIFLSNMVNNKRKITYEENSNKKIKITNC